MNRLPSLPTAIGRLALFCAAALSALTAGCGDSSPRFLDVTQLQNSADGHGPFQVAATVVGGVSYFLVRSFAPYILELTG